MAHTIQRVTRHLRESGGPGAAAAPLPLLDSRFRGNDDGAR
jgi:hypothetical protein